jgi:hypothetical protein
MKLPSYKVSELQNFLVKKNSPVTKSHGAQQPFPVLASRHRAVKIGKIFATELSKTLSL